ncbi:MAG: hypothetical protein KAI47_20430 [Deltaproteobacteria bacterium]|nr:hypothetical protein [Deltaproteobacteria bacterium]
MATDTIDTTEVSPQIEYVDGRKKESVWKKQVKIHAYIGETILLVAIFAIFNMGVMPANPGFYGISPNPFFAIVLLMVARYGFRAGIFSAILSSIVYYATVRTHVGVTTTQDLFAWEYAKPAMLLIVTGVIVGVLVQRHKIRIAKLEEDNDFLRKDNEKLKAGEEELRDVNVELAHRVVGATDTLPMLYKYAKKLNTLDIDGIFSALTELVQEVLKAGRVSVYALSGDQLQLHSRNGRRATGPQLQLEPPIWEELIGKRQVVTLHDLLSRNIQRKDIYLAGPLTEGPGGTLRAALVVEELEFLRYNPASVRLFGVVADWAANVLGKAAEYQKNPEERQRQENKMDILRAQRATMAPGVISPMTGAAAAGEVDTGVKVDQAYIESPTVILDHPPTNMPTSAAPAATANAPSPHASPGGTLGKLLAGANDQLFGSAQLGQVSTGSVVRNLEDVPLPSQTPRDRGMMQHMLTGELQLATEQGSPLAKLLAEIDGYVSGRKGSDRA